MSLAEEGCFPRPRPLLYAGVPSLVQLGASSGRIAALLAGELSAQRTASLTVVFHWGVDLFGQKPRFGMTWLSPGGSGSCPFSSSPDAQAPNSSPLSSKWESGVGRAQGTETQLPGWQSLQRRVPSALAKLPRASGIMTQVWALNSLGITNEGVLTSVDFVESVGRPFVSPQE